MTHEGKPSTSHGDQLLARLPAATAETLNDAQRSAIARAADEVAPKSWAPDHAVDIRISFPLARYFLTIVAGHERRDNIRIGQLRRAHPLRRVGNILFFGIAATAFYTAAALGVLIYSAVFEF
jgi:hypothetical protein